jgi:hypothetical protein
LKEQDDDIWQLGAHYLSREQMDELRLVIDRWRRDNADQQKVVIVRLPDLPNPGRSRARGAKGPTSVFSLLFVDPVAGLEPAAREVERSREAAERMFFYLQREPTLLAWEAEFASQRVLGTPEMKRFADAASTIATSTSGLVDSAKSVSDSVERLPALVTEERQRTIEQLATEFEQQRSATVQHVAQAFAAERAATHNKCLR